MNVFAPNQKIKSTVCFRRMTLLGVLIVYIFQSCEKFNDKPGPPENFYLFGGEGNETFFDVIESSPGEFLLCGTTSGDENGYDAYLVKADESGYLLASFTYNIEDNESARRIIRTNSGFAIAGIRNKTKTNQPAEIFILNLDENFNFTSSFSFLATGDSSAIAIQGFSPLPDGSLVLQVASRLNMNSSEIYIHKFNPAGEQLAAIYYTSPIRIESRHQLIPLDSSSFLLSFVDNFNNLQLRAYNENLEELWSVNTPGLYYTRLGNICLGDSNIYSSYYQSENQILIQKFSLSGNFESEFIVPGQGEVAALAEDENGKLWVAGTQLDEVNSRGGNIFLADFDGTGTIQTLSIQGGERDEKAHAMIISASGKKIVVGGCDSYGDNGTDGFLYIQN